MSRWAVWVSGGVISFGVAIAVSGVGGCNVHELGHLVTGWAAGVPFDGVIWCTPGSGRVLFAYQEPAFVGYSGGFVAALILLALHLTVIRRRMASFPWWMAGVAVLGTAMSQVVVGVLEGSDPQRYAEFQGNSAGLVAVLVGPLLVAAVIQLIVRRPTGPLRKQSEETGSG